MTIASMGVAICLLVSSAGAGAGRTSRPAAARDIGNQALSLAGLCSVHALVHHPLWKTVLNWIPFAGARAPIFVHTPLLTKRQAKILHWHLLGWLPQEIAHSLGLSPRTVQFHLSKMEAILKELGYHSGVGAFQAGWVRHKHVRLVAEIVVGAVETSFTIRQLRVLTAALRYYDQNRGTLEFHIRDDRIILGINQKIVLHVPDALARTLPKSPIRDTLLNARWNWKMAVGYLLTKEAEGISQRLSDLKERSVKANIHQRHPVRTLLRANA